MNQRQIGGELNWKQGQNLVGFNVTDVTTC